MKIRKTSFGQLSPLFEENGQTLIEHLVFEKEGRKHKHPVFETFTVLSGSGQVISGEEVHEVKEGDIVTIPPNTPHMMIPAEGEILKGFLWYHSAPAKHSGATI